MNEITLPFIAPVHGNSVFVISIEGCNGAGKTTLFNRYRSEHPDTECRLCVPEIYQNAKDMKHFMLFEASELCSALYYLGGAVEVFNQYDASYSKILYDRSVWSTFAAAFAKNPAIIPTLIDTLNAVKQHVFLPNLIVVLDASYETCKKRINNKKIGAEFDKDEKDAFKSKRRFYSILKDSGYPIVFLDVNNLSPEEVYNQFLDILSQMM